MVVFHFLAGPLPMVVLDIPGSAVDELVVAGLDEGHKVTLKAPEPAHHKGAVQVEGTLQDEMAQQEWFFLKTQIMAHSRKL